MLENFLKCSHTTKISQKIHKTAANRHSGVGGRVSLGICTARDARRGFHGGLREAGAQSAQALAHRPEGRQPHLVVSLVRHSQVQPVQHLVHFISFHFGFDSMSQKPVTSLRSEETGQDSRGILTAGLQGGPAAEPSPPAHQPPAFQSSGPTTCFSSGVRAAAAVLGSPRGPRKPPGQGPSQAPQAQAHHAPSRPASHL